MVAMDGWMDEQSRGHMLTFHARASSRVLILYKRNHSLGSQKPPTTMGTPMLRERERKTKQINQTNKERKEKEKGNVRMY